MLPQRDHFSFQLSFILDAHVFRRCIQDPHPRPLFTFNTWCVSPSCGMLSTSLQIAPTDCYYSFSIRLRFVFRIVCGLFLCVFSPTFLAEKSSYSELVVLVNFVMGNGRFRWRLGVLLLETGVYGGYYDRHICRLYMLHSIQHRTALAFISNWIRLVVKGTVHMFIEKYLQIDSSS